MSGGGRTVSEARSQVAGIVAVVALYFGEQLAAVVMPANLLRLAPMTASMTLATEAGSTLEPTRARVPLLITTLYLVTAIVAAAVFARRAEVD